MAPPAGIEKREQLDRLVKSGAKLVIHCFTTGKDDGSDSGSGVAQAFDALSNNLDASSDVELYRVDASSRPAVAAGLLAAEGGGTGYGGGDGVSPARWVFFNAGKMVGFHRN